MPVTILADSTPELPDTPPGLPVALYLIGTPIGNAGDWSFRAVETVRRLPVLACEDTRVTWKLLTMHGIPRPRTLFAYHDHNEEQAAGRIVGFLEAGVPVGLCTDAGTPGLSDPGYRAIRAAIDAGHPVIAIPGPNAAITALTLSGLPTSSYTCLGFPPRKEGQRRNFLAREANAPHTLLLYESPQRLGGLLADARTVLGDRQAAVCLELTKLHELVARGWLADLADRFREEDIKGEATVVIAGANKKFMRDGPPRDGDEAHDPTPIVAPRDGKKRTKRARIAPSG